MTEAYPHWREAVGWRSRRMLDVEDRDQWSCAGGSGRGVRGRDLS